MLLFAILTAHTTSHPVSRPLNLLFPLPGVECACQQLSSCYIPSCGPGVCSEANWLPLMPYWLDRRNTAQPPGRPPYLLSTHWSPSLPFCFSLQHLPPCGLFTHLWIIFHCSQLKHQPHEEKDIIPFVHCYFSRNQRSVWYSDVFSKYLLNEWL